MGYLRIRGRVANARDRRKYEDAEFLAGTDSIYAMIPESTLKKLGIESTGLRRFRVASGEIRGYSVGEAFIEI